MSITIPPELEQLGTALGLLNTGVDGPSLNIDFLTEPHRVLANMITGEDQRDALLGLLGDVLGSNGAGFEMPDAPTGETWLPLIEEGVGSLYAVVRVEGSGTSATVRLEIAGKVRRVGDGLNASATVRLPLLEFSGDGIEPLAGGPDGSMQLAAQVTGDAGPLVDADGMTVGGLSLRVSVATDPTTPVPATFGIVVEDLSFSGDAAPADLDLLDVASDFDRATVTLLLAALRTRATDSVSLRCLFALVGLGPPDDIPRLPLDDLAVDARGALHRWLRSLLLDAAARAAWLQHLADLVGANLDPVGGLCFGDDESSPCLTLETDADEATGAPRVRVGLVAQHAVDGSGATGRLVATAELLRVVVTQPIDVVALSEVRAVARLTGPPDDPLVEAHAVAAHTVTVGALDAGIALRSDRSVVPVLTAHDVDVSGTAFAALDLTDADAVVGTAVAVAAEAVGDLLGVLTEALDASERGRALAALLGLVQPVQGWVPKLCDPVKLLADPLRELACYHARVLAEDGSWSEMIQRVLILIAPDGIPTPAPTGTGTVNDPWRVALAPGDVDRVDLAVWQRQHDGRDHIVLAIEARTSVAITNDVTLDLLISSELLDAMLPDLADCSGPVSVDIARCHSLTLAIGNDLVLDTGAITVLANRIEAGVRWKRAGDPEPIVRIAGPRVVTGTGVVPLPDLDSDLGLDFGLDLSTLSAEAWAAIGDIFGAWFSGEGTSWWRLGALVGLLPGVPSLPGFIVPNRRDLTLAFDGEWRSFLDLSVGGSIRGNGTYEHPWTLGMGATDLPELIAWIDPDGPSPGPGWPRNLLPQRLTDALDGIGEALAPERLGELVGRAVQISPELADIVDQDLGAAMRLLRDQLADTDGLVPIEAQEVAGWASVMLPPTSHLIEPTALDLGRDLPGLPPASRQVFVSAPLPWASAWPGQNDEHVIDLTEPGREAGTFDLDHVVGDGPWYVLLPPRQNAVTAQVTNGLDGLVARLRAAVGAVRNTIGAPVALIAHGTSGHAARLLGAEPDLCSDIVTVGTPHATTPLGWLVDDRIRYAIRGLQRLRRRIPDDVKLDLDVGIFDSVIAALDGVVTERQGADLLHRHVPFPFADYVAPGTWPDLAPGVQGHAVVGSLDPDAIDGTFTELVGRALQEVSSRPADRPGPTHVGFGASARLQDGDATIGAVRVDADLRADVHLIQVADGDPTHRAVPKLHLHIDLARNGGWLLQPPDTGLGRRQDPRVRRAEFDVVVELGDPFPVADAAPRISAAIVLHDVSVLGRWHERWVIDDSTIGSLGDGASGGTGALPEARALLGLIAVALGPVPGTGTLRRLADLLVALDVAELDAADGLEFDTDGLEQLLRNPEVLLDELLDDNAKCAALLDAVVAFGDGSRGPGSLVVTSSPSVEVAVVGTFPNWALRVRTLAPVTIAKGIEFETEVTVDADGRIVGDVGLGSPVDLGPIGRPRLELGLDTGAAEPVSFAVRFPDDTLGTLPVEVALLPRPDLKALGSLLVPVVTGELLRYAATWAHAQHPSGVEHVEPLLDVLGLLAPPGAPLAVRSLAGIVADPAGWLGSTVSLGIAGPTRRLNPVRVTALVDALAALLGKAAGGGTLALPGGIELAVGAAPGGRTRMAMTLPAVAAGDTGVAGRLALFVSDDLDLAPELATTVTLGAIGNLDAAEVRLGVDAAGPTMSITLTPAGAQPLVLPLLPSASWGQLTALAGAGVRDGVQRVLPLALDAAAAEVPAIGTLGDALGVRIANTFNGAALSALAQDPAARLRDGTAAPAVLAALDGLLAAVGVPIVVITGNTITITPVLGLDIAVTLGAVPLFCVSSDQVQIVPGLEAGGEICVDETGILGAAAFAEVTDPTFLGTDPVVLLPFVRVEAGDRAPGADRVLAGLWDATPADAGRRALAVSLPFGGLPAVACLEADRTPAVDVAGCATQVALGVVLPLVVDVVVKTDEVGSLLDEPLLSTAKLLGDALVAAGLLERHGAEYRTPSALFTGLDVLPGRLLALGGHVLSAMVGGVLGDTLGPLSIVPAVENLSNRIWYGLRLSLNEPLTLASGADVGLELATYSGEHSDGDPTGLTMYVISHPVGKNLDDLDTVRFSPRLDASDIGLRVVGGGGGSLLEDPIGIERLELFGTYAGGVGFSDGAVDGWETSEGGGRIVVRHLSVALGGGGDGGNSVAKKMLSQASETSGGGDDEQLAAGFDVELEVTANSTNIHIGIGDPPWWIPVQRSFGPLYVDQFGLVVDPVDGPDRIGVLFDGGVVIGDLAIGIDDLSVTYHLDVEQLSLGLAGLAISYDGNGLTLAGGLRRHRDDYLGMLDLRFGDFGLAAIGGWGEHPDGRGDKYTALFVFGALSSSLGGPPAFFVTGIGAGFGLNRRLVLPRRIEDVPTFPLVDAMRSDSTLAQDPMGALGRLGESFPPHRGTFWFAAGLRFTSFVLVESVAVLSVEVGGGVEVSLLGLSRVVIPDPALPMANIELALRARFSTREGVLAIQAQLTDNSWLLSESCRLTGGFAFVVWFRTGQFVLTLGGYHPRFSRPADFPDVPRLGYHWSVSDAITIKGGLYFALTSSAVMAGGSFGASYRTSWSWASFEMGANALVMWDPFAYDFEVYVRVSAGVRIRVCVPLLGCATARFSFSIGARVHVRGPEFRGTARLDLDVVTITVRFGASGQQNTDQGLTWNEFRPRYLTDGDSSTGLEASLGNGRYVEAGAPASDAGDAVDGPWRLLPEFAISITTNVASNHFNGAPVPGVDVIDIGPMRRANVTTDLHAGLTGPGGPILIDGEQVDLTPRLGRQPEAVWRSYDTSGDAPPAARFVTAVVGARLTVRSKVLDRTGDIALDQVDPGERIHPLPLHNQIRWRGAFADFGDANGVLLQWADKRSAFEAAKTLQNSPTFRAVAAAGGESGRWRLERTRETERPEVDAALAADSIVGLATAEILSNRTRTARPVSLTGRAAPPRVRSLAAGIRRHPGERAVVTAANPPALTRRRAARLRPRLDALLHEISVPRNAVPATAAGRAGEGLPRVMPPSLDMMRDAGLRKISARLHTVHPPAAADGTRRAGDLTPSAIAGARHEWRAADPALKPEHCDAMRSLTDNLLRDGITLKAGQVQVWHVPDSHEDRSAERPVLEIGRTVALVEPQTRRQRWLRWLIGVFRPGPSGNDGAVGRDPGRNELPVRVVALDRTGRVLADETITEGEVQVPLGSSRVAVAGTSDVRRVVAGWHSSTRLARISTHTLLSPGAVVRSEAANSRRAGRRTATGLVTATDVVPARGSVETSLPNATRTVVVGLEAFGQQATPDGFALTMSGATRFSGPPLLVRAGERLYGVFAVVVADDADRCQAIVATDENWHLCAVLGSAHPPEDVATWLATGGLERSLPSLATDLVESATIRWREPNREEYA